jgi:hypothetical protein
MTFDAIQPKLSIPAALDVYAARYHNDALTSIKFETMSEIEGQTANDSHILAKIINKNTID